MDSETTQKIKKFRPKKDKYSIGAAAVAALFVIVVGIHLIVGSKAAVPTSPTLSNVCGVANASDIESYNPPAGQAPLTKKDGNETIAAYPALVDNIPNLQTFHTVTIGGTQELYALYSPTGSSGGTYSISVYNLSRGSTTPISNFPVGNWGNSSATFAVDPSGNVYVIDGVNAHTITKFSPSGTSLWQKSLPTNPQGGAYGYTAANGSFYVAYLTSTSSNPSYSQTGQSVVFDVNGNQQTNNNMIDNGETEQDQTTGDILAINGGMLRVYTNAGTLKFQMGTDQSGGGTFSLNNPYDAIENPSGGYYVSDSDGILSFDANGAYLGKAVNFQNANYAANTIGYSPQHIALSGGKIYYSAGGLDPWDSNFDQRAIYSITPAQLNIYASYPQGSSGVLGLGAGLTTATAASPTAVSHNYFPYGTTPAVSAAFYPWWAAQASNYTVTYEVRSMQQILANDPGTTQTLSLAALTGATVPTYLPVNIAGYTQPGAYEVSAHVYKNGSTAAVGADCIDYSVGAKGASYNPAAFTGGPNVAAVQEAHQLGQNYVRATIGLDDCVSSAAQTAARFNNQGNNSTLSSLPAFDCSPIDSDINAAATLAKSYGINFAIQLADKDSSLDYAMVNSVTTSCPGKFSGQSIEIYQCLTYEMASHYPNVTNWMMWNEFNNNFSASTAVSSLLQPAYTALKAVSSSETVIGGSILNSDPGAQAYWSALVGAGALNYMDAADVHPYPGDNRTYEEWGAVIPPLDVNPGQSVTLGGLDQIKKILGGKPMYDSEMGVWQSGPSSTYTQGSIIVRGTILQNSIGMNKISVFENDGCYQVASVNWGTIGCGHNGGDEPATTAQVTMARMLDGPTVSGNRAFLKWLPTGIPHTYAALYGPSATDTGDVAVVWADDFSDNVIPTLSNGAGMTVTSEYGASSTITSSAKLAIDGEVQYINVPVGQSLSFSPSEAYGVNLVLASNGTTATATSTANCSQLSVNNIITGQENAGSGGSRPFCGHATGWAQTNSDLSPTVTITLPSSQNIDRVLVSSSSVNSVDDGLRNFTVQVSNGGSFATVGTVTDSFFQRNHMVTFPAQQVKQIKITSMSANLSGYGNGFGPTFWNTLCSATDDSCPVYGQDTIFDVEAYAPGSGSKGQAPPPSIPTGLSAGSTSTSQATLKWTASTDTGGPGLGGYSVLENGQVVTKVGATTTSATITGLSASTAYTFSVEAYDTSSPALVSNPSNQVSVTTLAPVKPSTPTVSATAVSSSQVNVSWTASTDTGGPGLSGYYLMQNGVQIADLNSTTTSYVDTSVSPKTNYSYTVQAYDAANVLSSVSAAALVTTPAAPVVLPTAPTSVKASATSSTNVSLTWTASTDTGGPGIGGYYVIRNGVTLIKLAGTGTSWSDTTVIPSTSYSYVIEAYDTASNVSKPSSATNVSTPASPDTQPPTTPTNIVAAVSGTSQINLTWNKSTDNIAVKDYQVYRSTAGANASLVATIQTTSYGNTGLNSGTTYSYYVVAYDAAGNRSSNSATATATTQSVVTTTVTVYGVVTDSKTGLDLANVNVHTGKVGTLNGAAQSTTNSQGQYLLQNIIPNRYHYYYYSVRSYKIVHFYTKYRVGKYPVNEALVSRK